MTFTPAANSIRWLSFRNNSGETVPPFAVLRPLGVITVEGQAVLTVGQPNSDGGGFYFFNGPFPVVAGGFGSCTADFPCFAAYDTTDPPVLGEEWGAASGQWTLAQGKTGYKIIGGAVDGRVEITASQPSSSLVHFYLNADLARGASQSAQMLEWNGAAWFPGASTIEVFDSSKIGPAKATQLGVCYVSSESDRYEIVTLERTSAAVRWAKATAKWTNQAGNGSYVACHQALDRSGTLELDGGGQPIPVTVYLPRCGFGDPNVRADDVIGYQLDPAGDATCVTDYLDDPIGTVKMWVADEQDVKAGWRIYGPSPGRFPVGVTSSDEDIPATVPGATGGQKKHTHDYEGQGIRTFTTALATLPAGQVTAQISGATLTGNGNTHFTDIQDNQPGVSITGSGNVNTSTNKANADLGITVNSHPNHYHPMTFATFTLEPASGSGINVYAQTQVSVNSELGIGFQGANHLNHTVNELPHGHTVSRSLIAAGLDGTLSGNHRHSYRTSDFAADLSLSPFDITVPDHTHSITPNPHDHGLPNPPQEKHIPPFFGIYFIERFE